MKKSRAILGGFIGLLAILAGVRVALESAGRSKLEAFVAGLEKGIAEQRARVAALRRPVLRGAPVDENAVARYRPLIESTKAPLEGRKLDVAALGKAVAAGPFAPLPADAKKALEERRDDIRKLREALACTRCDWELRYEDGPAMALPQLVPIRALSNLLIIEGHERAAAGDARGAAERYLDAARFGTDVAAEGTLLQVMIGVALDVEALRQLGRLVCGAPPGSLPTGELAPELAKLEPALPRTATGFRVDRLWFGGIAFGALKDPSWGGLGMSGPRPVLTVLLPERFILADACVKLDAAMRDLERQSEPDDPRERARLADASPWRQPNDWNPIVNIALPGTARARRQADHALAAFRLVRTAFALEQARSADGRTPAAPELPVDPLSPDASRLRFETAPDAKGWRLWSVGENGKDDGGVGKSPADDAALERKPPQ